MLCSPAVFYFYACCQVSHHQLGCASVTDRNQQRMHHQLISSSIYTTLMINRCISEVETDPEERSASVRVGQITSPTCNNQSHHETTNPSPIIYYNEEKAHCGTTAAALAATRITTTTTDTYNFLSEKICMPLNFSLTHTIIMDWSINQVQIDPKHSSNKNKNLALSGSEVLW